MEGCYMVANLTNDLESPEFARGLARFDFMEIFDQILEKGDCNPDVFLLGI